ncbi:MAG: family 20 glycosylhydrolase [Chitinophagaceae bacterium]
MKKIPIILLLSVISSAVFAQATNSIIPRPVSIEMGEGSFVVDNNTVIKYNRAQKALKNAADFMVAHIKQISAYNLSVGGNKTKTIELKFGKNAAIGDEGYELIVSPKQIIISANTTAGIIYGTQSLFQTLPQVRTNEPLQIPAMQITDYPRFKWRGMHLDVSRHFFAPWMIKEYIDLMASYKLNTFHWHLVDDQGWRIEIKKYPLLTKIGGWRVDKLDQVWSQRPQAVEGEEANYGGYYTKDQIRDIIQYAAQRNVTIVPEIEMPGHVASAIAAYPYLSCTQKPQLPLTGGDYSNMSSNYCAGNDSVFTFLQNVLTEVIDLFPSKYIHIGGDEVDKGPWKVCPKCQGRIKAEGLHNEDELQSYFIKRIENFVESKKRKIVGWDEILEGGLAPSATVMSWRGEAGGIEAAKMHHNVVMTPGNPLYFDHYQAGPEGEPVAIGGMNTLKKVYEYNPIPKELTEEQAKYVIGAQANVWAEYILTPAGVEYMVLPRMLALAEVVWSPLEGKDFNDFSTRMQYHFKGFDQRGLNYSKGNFTVAIKPVAANGKVQVALSTEALNGDIFYTTDGSIPNTESRKYTQPFNIDSSVVVKAVTAVRGTVLGLVPAQQSFAVHMALGKNVSYTNPVSRYYLADGPNSLTDGVRGTKAVGKYWHGFSAKDLVATVDLGEERSIHSIELGCLQNYSDWIFLPSSVKFESSDDGTNFGEISTLVNPVSVNEKSALHSFVSDFSPKKARYIRVTAKNNLCPPGHPGAGKPAWIFADEIVVK